MKPNKLRYEYVAGGGHQIKAHLGESVDCVEYRLRGDAAQTVLEGSIETLLAYAPFRQFAPAKWDEMISKLYREMVEAWNEKHSNTEHSEKGGGGEC